MNQEVKGAVIALGSIFSFLLVLAILSKFIPVSGYKPTGVYTPADTAFNENDKLYLSRV
jgi:hypothetical protein